MNRVAKMKEYWKQQPTIDEASLTYTKFTTGAWLFLGLCLAYAITIIVALSGGLPKTGFQLLNVRLLDNVLVWSLFSVLIMALFFVPILLVGWLQQRVSGSAWGKKRAFFVFFEVVVYVALCALTIGLSATVDKYDGRFHAVPFVVFAVGASLTESLGFFFLTLGLHAAIYLVIAFSWWGAAEDLPKFAATAGIAYACVILPKILIERPRWLTARHSAVARLMEFGTRFITRGLPKTAARELTDEIHEEIHRSGTSDERPNK